MVNFADEFGPYDFEEKQAGNVKAQLTTMDRLSLVGKLGSIPFRAMFWGLQYAVSPNIDRRRSTSDHVKNRAIAYVTNNLSLQQFRALMPVRPVRLELKALASHARTNGLNNFNKMFHGEGFSARWIHEVPNRTPDDPVIIYLHGGGFVLKAAEPQLTYIIFFANKLKDHRVSILIHDYTITPYKVYPEQINQAIRLYNQVVAPKKSAGDNVYSKRVILLGESCGGTMATAMALQYKYPRQELEPMANKPWGMTLVSPAMSYDYDLGGSFYSKGDIDIINWHTLKFMRDLYITSDQMSNPFINCLTRTDAEYWKDVIPRNTCAVWGEDECLRDTTREWVALAGVKETFEEPFGVHDTMLQGVDEQSTHFMLSAIKEWFRGA